MTVSASLQNSYYLIVPNNAVFEGSYGEASNGAPRQQGLNSCFGTNIAPCDN